MKLISTRSMKEAREGTDFLPVISTVNGWDSQLAGAAAQVMALQLKPYRWDLTSLLALTSHTDSNLPPQL